MLPELKELKAIRKSLGISRKVLAKKAGISESLLVKIESGKVMPSYEKVKRIYESLCSPLYTEKAEDFMNKKIISVDANDLVGKAIDLMKTNGYSQLPVFERGKVVGSITEGILFNSVIKGISLENLRKKKVSEVMGNPFPMVETSVSLEEVLYKLKFSKAVLVTEKRNPVGIITKSDVI